MRVDQVRSFFAAVTREGKSQGMTFLSEKPFFKPMSDPSRLLLDAYIGEVTAFAASERAKRLATVGGVYSPIVVFMLRERESSLYNEIKRRCDVEYGIACQVVLAKNVNTVALAKSNMVATNLLYKINLKLISHGYLHCATELRFAGAWRR